MASTIEQRGPRLGLEELKLAAAEMRAVDLIDIFAAGSGHPGGTLSISGRNRAGRNRRRTPGGRLRQHRGGSDSREPAEFPIAAFIG